MSDNSNYSTELTEIVVSLQENLCKCVSLIKQITQDSDELKKQNSELNNNFKELSEEMANYTKVSFVSNLSKQITKKNDDIDVLQRKIDRLEKERNLVNDSKNDKDILLEITTTLDKPHEDLDEPLLDNRVEHVLEDYQQAELLNKDSPINLDIVNLEEHTVNSDVKKLEYNVEEEEEGKEIEQKEEEEEEEEEEMEQKQEEEEEVGEEMEQKQEEGEQVGEEEEVGEGEEEEEEEEEEMEFELKKIKRKYYYLSNEVPAGVYARDPDDEVGDKIGEFINNKLVKSS